MGILECPTIIRVVRTPHNAEGHLLSLRSPLDRLPVTDCQGSGIGASESLSRPALLARLSGPNRTPCHVVRWRHPAKRRHFGDGSQNPSASRARRARHPAVGADRSYRTAAPDSEWLTATPSRCVFVRYQRRSRRAYSEHRSHSLARRAPSGVRDDKPALWNARLALTKSQRPALLVMLSSDVGPSTNN
jgi:hypothetical protein